MMTLRFCLAVAQTFSGDSSGLLGTRAFFSAMEVGSECPGSLQPKCDVPPQVSEAQPVPDSLDEKQDFRRTMPTYSHSSFPSTPPTPLLATPSTDSVTLYCAGSVMANTRYSPEQKQYNIFKLCASLQFHSTYATRRAWQNSHQADLVKWSLAHVQYIHRLRQFEDIDAGYAVNLDLPAYLSTPALQCPYCRHFLPNAVVLLHHLINPLTYREHERVRRYRGQYVAPSERSPFCDTMAQLMAEFENQTNSHLPPELLQLFATTNQVVQASTVLRYDPVICPRCRCWVKHKWALLWHTLCPEICLTAVKKLVSVYGRLHVALDSMYFLEIAYLASQTNCNKQRALLFWRHAITAVIRHTFAKLVNTAALTTMWRSFLRNADPARKHSHPVPPSFIFRQISTYIPLFPSTQLAIKHVIRCYKDCIGHTHFSTHQQINYPFSHADMLGPPRCVRGSYLTQVPSPS